MKIIDKILLSSAKKINSILNVKGIQFNNYDDAFYVNENLLRMKKAYNNYSSWSGDCADIWGKWFTKAVFRLYDDGEEVESHPVLSLLNNPNSFQTRWEVMFRLAHHIIFYGNSYFYLQRDKLNIPREFIQLNPEAVNPISSKDKYISHYKFFNGKGYTEIPKEDIIHFRNPDADSLIKGKPVIAKIFNQIECDYLQTEYQRNFYKKGGFLGLTFSTPQALGKDSFDRAVGMLKNNLSGSANSYGVNLFDNDLKPINVTHSIRDMDISAQRILSRDEITSAFEVQKLLLGIGEATNRATAEVATYLFVSGVVDPYMTYFSEVMTQQLCSQFGESYYIKNDVLAKADIETNLKYYENGIRNGWLSQNEVRELEEYEELDIPTMQVPLDISNISKQQTQIN